MVAAAVLTGRLFQMSNYNVVRPPGTDPMATISTSIKYLTQPHDGQPGTLWDDFEERLLNVLAGKSCENGWLVARRLRPASRRGLGRWTGDARRD